MLIKQDGIASRVGGVDDVQRAVRDSSFHQFGWTFATADFGSWRFSMVNRSNTSGLRTWMGTLVLALWMIGAMTPAITYAADDDAPYVVLSTP